MHIVAVSARTPLGLTAKTSAAAAHARISRLGEHPFMVDAAGNRLKCGRDARLGTELFGARRIEELARGALVDLISDLTACAGAPGPIDVALALPEHRPGFGRDDAAAVVRAAGAPIEQKEVRVSPIGEGHAGALHGLSIASEAIADGRRELVVVGGADSYLEADTLDWLDADKRLAREGVRGGFPPGEAAGFVALASDSTRSLLGLPSLGQVVGAAIAHESRNWDGDEGLLGEGLTQAILQASARLQLPREQATDVYCDINGERLRTDDWGLATLRTQHVFRDPSAYTACVGEWGDVGAATGALGCVLAAWSWRRGHARGPRAVVWGASWGGLRGACVIERGDG